MWLKAVLGLLTALPTILELVKTILNSTKTKPKDVIAQTSGAFKDLKKAKNAKQRTTALKRIASTLK